MVRVFLAAAAAAILAGCGTVTRGVTEDVPVQVQPSTAKVTTDIGMSCTGPCVLKVPRKKSFTVTATAPGYMPGSVAVGTRISRAGGWSMAGNAVSAGLIGAGVDVSTGAMKDHFPNPVVLVLQPARMDPLPAAPKAKSSRKGKGIAAARKPRIVPASTRRSARDTVGEGAGAPKLATPRRPQPKPAAAARMETRLEAPKTPAEAASPPAGPPTDFPLGVNSPKPAPAAPCRGGPPVAAGGASAAPPCVD